MKVNGTHYHTIWMEGSSVFMIDQNLLPFEFKIHEAKTCHETCLAIINMITRGAGAIGAAAGFAMAQAFIEEGAPFGYAQGEGRGASEGMRISDFGFRNGGELETMDNGQLTMNNGKGTSEGMRISDFGLRIEEHHAHGAMRLAKMQYVEQARKEIEATRPTARNLFYATEKVFNAGLISIEAAVAEALRLAEENLSDAIKIGEHGNELIKEGFRILTHCNAGWLGFVDYGSALSPIYMAHREGKKIHVYADETRPRSQGARLTAWELKNEGVPHTIIPDNAGAYLMSKGMIDMVIVGADRIAANGDTANKIGTFEKAIVARQFGVPFYIAAPTSTFDLSIPDGNSIVIEERNEDEVHFQSGPDEEGVIRKIRVTSPGSQAFNPAFDVTPAEFIKGIITEKGVVDASVETIRRLLAPAF
jgi:methylthioribose-1-phosphate isomerase